MTEYSKRHELPESEDELKVLFDTLTQPLAEQSRDRLMRDIVNSAIWVDAQLNDGPGVDNDVFIESLAALNEDLDACGVLHEKVVVTGKLRPVLDESIAADGGTIIDIELPPSITKFGELKRDEEGPYLEIQYCTLTCGQFDVLPKRSVHFSDPSRKYQGVILKLGLQPDDDDALLPFYAYLDDMVEIEPKEPSLQKIYENIDDNYPAIAEQLYKLPCDIRDWQKIIQKMTAFNLEINWADYPKHEEEERQTLLEQIELYITNRINFDTDAYEVSIRDYMYGVNKDNEQTIVEDSLEECRVIKISHVRLEELEAEGPVQRFALMVESSASARGHSNGAHRLYIPAANISSIRNLRNNSFRPKGLDTSYDDESFVAEVPVEGATAIKQAIESVGEPEPLRSKEQDLIDLEAMYSLLMSEVSPYTTRVYQTVEEAREARDQAVAIVSAFRDAYPLTGVAIEASGPGVAVVNTSWGKNDLVHDDENDTFSVTLRNIATQHNNPLTIENGLFNGEIRTMIAYDEDEDGYVVRTYVMCKSVTNLMVEPLTFGLETEQVPLFKLVPERTMAFEVNNQRVSISIPEYTRIRRARSAIARIKREQLPEFDDLAGELEKLLGYMIENSRKEFSEFPDAGLLVRIGEHAAEDTAKTELAVAALEDMFIDRIVQVVGELYDQTGEIVPGGTVYGKVFYVVSEAPNMRTNEPMLVFMGNPNDSADDSTPHIYAPLSKIKSMVY